MSFVFQQGSTLLLTDGITFGRELLITSLSMSQTYLEESVSVMTLHSPNMIQDTFSNSKSNVSVEFSIHLTPQDGIVFEWFGFPKVVDKYMITPQAQLVAMDLYLISGSTIYRANQAYATTLSLQLAKTAPLSIGVSATASNWTEVSALPAVPITKQNSQNFMHGFLDLGDSSKFGGITLELTRDITWLSNKTVHSVLSGVYIPDTAVLQDLSISGTIAYYKIDDTLGQAYNVPIDITYNNNFKVYLDNCKYLERWETNEVHKKLRDFKLLPSSTNAYIQF
jgi:hypothetical protein